MTSTFRRLLDEKDPAYVNISLPESPRELKRLYEDVLAVHHRTCDQHAALDYIAKKLREVEGGPPIDS